MRSLFLGVLLGNTGSVLRNRLREKRLLLKRVGGGAAWGVGGVLNFSWFWIGGLRLENKAPAVANGGLSGSRETGLRGAWKGYS